MQLQQCCLNLMNSFFEASKANEYIFQFMKQDVQIYSTKLINKNMFQVSNKSTQKTYEVGSKFKIKNDPTEYQMWCLYC